jgi:phytoene synthase
MIRKGSKSFAGAARLLDPATRESVYMLYAWCRHCDDRIDVQELGRGAPAPAGSTGRDVLDELERRTRRAVAGQADANAVFAGLQRVVAEHGIPHRHPLELLHGFGMDVEGRVYRTLDDLLDYCYHVAGVVGVMMAHVMGVRDSGAIDRAADMGIALQLTNIARDVRDDASAGRVYLPADWLDRAGVEPGAVAAPHHAAAVAGVVRRLLAEADRYYRSGSGGLPALSFRSAWAIAVAQGVYRDIGRLVLRRGERAWERRAVVGKPRKLYRLVHGGVQAFAATSMGRRASRAPREGLWQRPG